MSQTGKLSRQLSPHEKLLARIAIRRRQISKHTVKRVLRASPGRQEHIALLLIEAGELDGEVLPELIDEMGRSAREEAEREDGWLRRALHDLRRIVPAAVEECVREQAEETRGGEYHCLAHYLIRAGHLSPESYLELARQLQEEEEGAGERSTVRCPHCHAGFRVAAEKIGRRVRCKKCGEAFRALAQELSADPAARTVSLESTGSHRERGRTSSRRRKGAESGEVTRPQASDSSLLPHKLELEDYELLAEIARGGMGIVYKARQKSLDRVVALKVLKDSQLASRASLKRFLREAQAAGKLTHPNIVTIYEVHVDGEVPYFSMDYVEGEPLDTLLADKRLPVKRGVEVLVSLARALHYCHTMGIIHRDIKPANVILARDGTPKITDFGLAKAVAARGRLTRSGHPIGTPYYMSPEQARGDREAMTARTDVYSLGVILYELLAGRVPFVGRSNQNIYYKIEHEAPRSPRAINPRAPRDLAVIALKAIAKRPADRYGSAEELALELERWQEGQPIRTRPPGLLLRAGRWLFRHRTAVAAAAGAALLAGGGVALVARGRGGDKRSASPQPSPARPDPPAQQQPAAPDAAGALVRARKLLDDGRLAAALDVIDELLQKHPGQLEAYLERARIYYYLSNHEVAARDLRRFLAARPEDVEGRFLLGANLSKQGKPVEALPHLQAAVRAAPKNPRYRLYLGEAYYLKSKSGAMEIEATHGATKACQDALELDPGLVLARRNLAWLHLESHSYKQALEQTRRVLELCPWDNEVRMMLANIYILSQQYQRAHTTLLELSHVPAPPSSGPAARRKTLLRELFAGGPWFGSGRQAPQGEGLDIGKSMAEWRQAMMSQNPKKAQELIWRGLVTVALDHYHGAESMFTKLLVPAIDQAIGSGEPVLVGPGFPLKSITREDVILYYLARSRQAAGNHALTRQTLDYLLKHYPKHGEGRLASAELALEMKDTKLAIDETARLLAAGKQWGQVHLVRAQALRAGGRLDEALRVLQDGLRENNRLYPLHVARGDLLLELKRRKEALQAYRNALLLEPAQPALREKLARLLK